MKKIIFAGRSVYHFSYYESLAQALVSSGYKITFFFDYNWSIDQPSVALDNFKEQYPQVEFRFYNASDLSLRKHHFVARELLTCINYLQRKSTQSDFYLKRWVRYLPKYLRTIFSVKIIRNSLKKYCFLANFLEKYINSFKVSDYLVNIFETISPDLLISTPVNLRYSTEVEFVRAAKQFGVPSYTPVLTWDNLTTKGLFHVKPDYLSVWNEDHYKEAKLIHGFSENSLSINGSLFFDKWLNHDLLLDKPQIYTFLDIPSSSDYILYLGSSGNIARNESQEVCRLADSLYPLINRIGRKVFIVVKSHPANIIDTQKLLSHDLVKVWPSCTLLPESTTSKQLFYSALKHSIDTVGINTSAMLDAICVNGTSSSIILKKYQKTQSLCSHFKALEIQPNLQTFSEYSDYINYLIYKSLFSPNPNTDINFIRPDSSELVADKILRQIKNIMDQ